MIKNKVLETIKEYKMLEAGDHVLVAVSGGPDSCALLYLLDSLKQEFGIKLHIAHLNHLIRKGDAELDVRFVQGLAQNLNVPITVESFDVSSFAKKNKLGIEAAARIVRYDFFERAAKKVGATKIAVGHSADDNVETFLMRLLRGSGLKGLCGIPPKREKIIRPLIKVWQREIEDYVGALKLVPRRDYTNYESKYLRNRVRMKLIPQLKIYNLNIKEIILQTILLVTDDSGYLEDKAEEALQNALKASSEAEIRLSIFELKQFEDPIKRHLIRAAIERVKGDLSELSYKHVHDIIDKFDSRGKWELHLPDNIFVYGDRNELIITRERQVEPARKSFFYSFSIPGEKDIAEIGKKIRASFCEEAISDDPNLAFVDHQVLGEKIIVRNRAEGDKFFPLGMKGSKKLQDFFVDEKVPLKLRDSIPIIESDGKIVWVAGYRLNDRAKVTKKTKKIVKLELL
ncbi:MAG: tRNA lysidine(34) synthetase TilS [Candidatus Saganbacteria bacterium]|nr:tRNA lysidine(34) synthetase TilS [Candidatus Saganbacteria bacterium]